MWYLDKCHVEAATDTIHFGNFTKARNWTYTLSNSIQQKDMFFTADVVLIQFHQKIAKNGHWSSNARSKEQALSAINVYLCKGLTFAHKTEEINQWQFLELSEVGLQKQVDDYSYGVFTW